MVNQQPVPAFNFAKIVVPEFDISRLAKTMSKIVVPEFDIAQLAKITVPEFDITQLAKTMSKITVPEFDITQLAKTMSKITVTNIDISRTVSFPDGFFESIRELDHSSKYPLSSFLVQGAALDEYLCPEESELLLADGAADELRWSLGELWDSFTEQQQRFIKLGFLGGLFVAIFVAIFMAQTQYQEFGQFVESAGAPAALAAFVISVVGPNLMNTKTHPINKWIRRN
ncbi:hypothetical protein ACIGB6_14495 [Paeniglutamicibacter gangotriensis]|uniref:hypothetical protein n=1 Tax=Paeniglutamicibacter gangotriensis TaxID=254787 RepID=UPI0037C6552C